MKTAGLIGGTSWHSTMEYYRIINEAINLKLGDDVSPPLLLKSIDFSELKAMQYRGDWQAIGDLIIENANALQAGGADFLVICANTLHKVLPQIKDKLNLPIVHIVDALIAQIEKTSYTKLGLMATSYTMKSNFYQEQFKANRDLEIVLPDEEDMEILDRIIYKELIRGMKKDSSRDDIKQIMNRLKAKGVDALIAGCTELSLLIKPSDCPLALFDTLLIHAATVANKILV